MAAGWVKWGPVPVPLGLPGSSWPVMLAIRDLASSLEAVRAACKLFIVLSH